MKKTTLFWLFLLAQPLVAQTVVSVRSGQHEGFTRLVLDVGQNVDWQMETQSGEARLFFPGQRFSFVTDEVFQRISTEKISAVQGESGNDNSSLRLELDCACEVKSFNYGGQYIVVDVLDGPELEAEPPVEITGRWQPDSLPSITGPAVLEPFTARIMLDAPLQPGLQPEPEPVKSSPVEMPDGVSLAEPQAPDMMAEIEASVGALAGEMNAEITVEDNPELRARIEEAQTQLLAQLTRAADQGLVEFSTSPVVESVSDARPENPPEIPPENPPDHDPVAPELLQQLSARTAYSQNTEDALAEIVNQFAKPQCLEDAAFSMDGWGDESGFSARLARLRTGLLKEFDVVDPEVQEAIVKLYLRYGLGAEARMILLQSEGNLANSTILMDIAEALEKNFSGVLGPVLQGAGCGGAHEMWYLVTGRGNYQVMEPLAITEVFSSYPIEVRTLIGPPLADAFMARGQVNAGHVVLEIVRRAEGEVTVAQRMSEAKVREAQMDFQGAGNIYRELMKTNDEQAPDAMMALARLRLQAGEPVPPSLLVDLESAAFFYRNSPKADPLRLWEIRVRAEVAGEADALAQIVETQAERGWLTPDLQKIAAEIFISARAEAMGDYPYAQMALEYSALLDQGLAGDAARLAIAKELAAVGLPETALDILAPNLQRPDPAALHMAAAAKVQLFEPESALAMLDGDQGLEAYKIRLKAYLQMEDFAAVARLLSEDFSSEISLEDIALRAGDWEKIQAEGMVGTLASFANGGGSGQPVQSVPTPEGGFLAVLPLEEAPSLKGVRELLMINRSSRRFLQDVISQSGQ